MNGPILKYRKASLLRPFENYELEKWEEPVLDPTPPLEGFL